MKWTWDTEADALYVLLTDAEPSRQEEVDGLVVDLDANGHVVGIEILSAHHPWTLQPVVGRYEFTDDQQKSLAMVDLMGRGRTAISEFARRVAVRREPLATAAPAVLDMQRVRAIA
jgi:uncharacterized protein YuzE